MKGHKHTCTHMTVVGGASNVPTTAGIQIAQFRICPIVSPVPRIPTICTRKISRDTDWFLSTLACYFPWNEWAADNSVATPCRGHKSERRHPLRNDTDTCQSAGPTWVSATAGLVRRHRFRPKQPRRTCKRNPSMQFSVSQTKCSRFPNISCSVVLNMGIPIQ